MTPDRAKAILAALPRFGMGAMSQAEATELLEDFMAIKAALGCLNEGMLAIAGRNPNSTPLSLEGAQSMARVAMFAADQALAVANLELTGSVAPDRGCLVAGCTNLAAGHQTAHMCWRHEGDYIEAAAYSQGVEAAAKLMEENAGCFRRSGHPEVAYQLVAEAQHIRTLKR